MQKTSDVTRRPFTAVNHSSAQSLDVGRNLLEQTIATDTPKDVVEQHFKDNKARLPSAGNTMYLSTSPESLWDDCSIVVQHPVRDTIENTFQVSHRRSRRRKEDIETFHGAVSGFDSGIIWSSIDQFTPYELDLAYLPTLAKLCEIWPQTRV